MGKGLPEVLKGLEERIISRLPEKVLGINKRVLAQFVKFMFSNQLAWVGDVLTFTLAFEVVRISHYPAKALSYSVGTVLSYLLNRRFTFDTKKRFFSSQFVKFILVNCISIGLSLAAMYVVTEVLFLPVWAGYFISILFSFSNNYLANRFWVFAKKEG